jgi:hypothetical protein
MSDTAETKICPFCSETVKAAAKKCPFCNSRLVRYALFRQELILGIACLIFLGFFIWACVVIFPESDSITEGRSFTGHRDDLKVVKIEAGIDKRGTSAFYYTVTGIVTNEGQYPWRVQTLELTLSNNQGVIDILHPEIKNPFVVQPHTEHAFVLDSETTVTNSIVAASARVENARDGNLLPKDND